MIQQSQFIETVETGLQLYARLSSENRPSTIHLDENIFGSTPLEPNNKQTTIEITGESNSGKSFMLKNIIAKALIKGTRIILIETDNTMNFSTLITLLESEIKDDENSCDKQMEIIENCLKNLTILRCYSDFDLEVVLLSKLEEILLDDKNIAFIAVDSISAYYWSEFNPDEPIRMDTYLTNMLRRLKRICDDYKLIFAYTRPSSFISGIRSSQDDKLIDYRIELKAIDDKNDDYSNDDDDCENFFEAKISFSDKKEVKRFMISSFGINWI